ncbi:RNA-binding domain-containing protein [Sistotremastrum suecicum HHB10207 ss-3]|uniref:RNA-binding domain-containing protein n=1 Tax=Sistotremastrum suecicum HHB10207 ss-3 TaxID=1314776 RepID=A0A166HSS8_9AGAM|nr:RNA-binding domain-containing protein [Sistotremastrum suecicum HHB10207 ss-3]
MHLLYVLFHISLFFHRVLHISPLSKQAPNPSNVLGVFGLSIRTREQDLEDEFSRHGRVEKVTIVYDQRALQSERSRGFGFIRMATVDDAARCVTELNGIELNGRRIRVDYSVTDRPHAPTPGEYMGHRRAGYKDSYSGGGGGDRGGRDSRDYRDRDRDYRGGGRERGRYDRSDRDSYGRDWRDRRSPPPRRYSPDRRSRRSYSRSPPRGGGSPGRNY